MSPPDDRELRAWAYLSRVAEPPCPALAALAATYGAVAAAERVRRREVDAHLSALTAARAHLDCAADDLAAVDRLGGRLLTPADAGWPGHAFASFTHLDHHQRPRGHVPLALWVVGASDLAGVAARSAALVGTRAATGYGEHVAADLAAGLAERAVAVVSGGAYGIDGAAHRAALAADGTTVAVLAGGVDVPYPAGHAALLRRIGAHGALVSEYPPGERPMRHRFLTRNRLVAALGTVTVVVEAGLRSGAANTAAWAGALGRPVCAVPGPVTSSASAGAHALIRSGAYLVTRAAEVVELAGRIGELAPDPARPTTPLDGLDELERRVHDALPARGDLAVEDIAVAAGVPATQILGPLAVLQLAGLCDCRGGRWGLS